jgi:3-oxoacyl-[acyl-carrier-protein] synthase II
VALTPITPRRVVITGIGAITPIGNTIDALWDSLENGKSGISNITHFDTSEFPVHIAGEVKDFDPTLCIERKEARHMDLYSQYAVTSSVQAIEDSKINFDNCDRDRIGVIIGSGIGGMNTSENQHSLLMKRGPRRISPFYIPMLISDIAAGLVSIRYQLRGPNYATTSACATSAHALGVAMKTIRYNDADVIIAGGSEAPITNMGLGGFCSLKALSTRNDAPEIASRPFDLKRDGFIMAEGAGIMVLEELEHAKARGAHIYGELAGAGFTGDGHHITAPAEDGNGAIRAMKIAVKDAGLELSDIDYINAHGTSTQLNDKSETAAIKVAFGEHASKLAVSSTKSMHGHMLGAAGSVEAITALLAIEKGIIPPTINYEFLDPDCDLDITPNIAVKKTVNAAISNNFGFGGHNASLVIKRYS